MKKKLIVILSFLLLIGFSFGLLACGKVKNFNIYFNVDGEIYDTIKTDGSSSITIPNNPVKEGYIFDGWYWDNGTWQKPFTANSLLDAPITSDMTVYAKWKGDGLYFKSLYVDSNNNVYGKVSNSQTTFSFINEVEMIGSATFVVSTDIYGMQQIPTKTVPLSIGNNTFYITESVGNNIKLYTVTVRRKPIYTVYFNSDGGTSVDTQFIEEDAFAVEPNNPTKTGYTFVKWDYDFANAITRYTTITAKWTANTYTIKYNANTGSGEMSDLTMTYDTAKNLTANSFAKLGYSFKGWATNSNGNVVYSDSQSVKNLTIINNDEINLYAVWKRDTYSITYNLNGGENNYSNPVTYNVESSTITLVNPSKVTKVETNYTNKGNGNFEKKVDTTEYTFLGWYSESTFDNKIEYIKYMGVYIYLSKIRWLSAQAFPF